MLLGDGGPPNPVKGSPLLGLLRDTRLGRCVQWQRHPPTLSLIEGNAAPIFPTHVPLRFHETGVWLCCRELIKAFSPLFLSFSPFVSFSTLTVSNVQSVLITRFLLYRRLTYYANYTWNIWPSISAGATFCIYYPLTYSSHILILNFIAS